MMLKGLKEALTVLIVTHVTYVKGVKRSLTVLLITFLIFNRFLIWKKFWKAETETFTTIPANAMYVEGVKSYFDFWSLQHASTYIALDGMVGKISVSAFQNFFWIENQLNIKKVMSKNVMSPYSIFWRGQRPLYTEYTFDPFDMSKMSNITLYTVLCKSHKLYFRHFRHE